MKIRKSIKTVVALILTLTIALLIPVQTSAAKNGKYVSEVYVAYGKNAEAAKKTLEDKGFTPVEGNLNDGGKTYAMMGYRTTDNIRDSITDLAVMNMRGDYSVDEYRTLLQKKKADIAEFLKEFMSIIREYRANLKAGKTKATYIHDLLNFYTEDDTGMKMGDLLNSVTLQDKVGIEESIEAPNPDKLPDLVTIIMQGNAQVIKSMEILLSMATDAADNSWIDRFAALDYDGLLDKVEKERPELNTETKRTQYLDNLYGDAADVLALETATLKERLNDYTKLGLYVSSVTEEEVKKHFGNVKDDLDAMIKYREWLSISSIYEGLKDYEGGRFKKGELLEFFLKDYNADDRESFIPMAAALSEGQLNGLPFVALNQLVLYAFTTEQGWKDSADQYKSFTKSAESVSVYQNIDRGLYKDDGSVALTGAAQRANNTADGTTGDKEAQMEALSKITAISWAATLGGIITTIASVKVLRKYVFGELQKVNERYLQRDLFEAFLYNDKYEKILESVHDGYLDKAVITKLDKMRLAGQLVRLVYVITLAVAITSAVLTIIDLCRDKSITQLPIPGYLVDNHTDADGGNYAINYKAVECNRMEYFGNSYKRQKGNSADLLADEGKQWLVLYASKNSMAGSSNPLTPDFIVQKSNKSPDGYNSWVHLIGEKGAVNVAGGAFRNYSTFSQTWQNITGDYTMYIFHKLSDEIKTYDESAGNMTASARGNGMAAVWGFGGLAVGAVLGAVVTVLVKKKKKTEA